MTVVFCVQYAVAIWFAVGTPWTSALSSVRAFNIARVLALALPPVILACGVVMVCHRRAIQGKVLLVVAVGVLLALNWHLTHTHAELSALARERSSGEGDSHERLQQFRQVMEPLLGDISAYAIEVEDFYGVADHVTRVRFRTDDLECLREGLKTHGWTFHETKWLRQKMLNGVGGSCRLRYYKDKTDGSWVVHFSEVR
jgi:hypothetical protein